MRLPRQLLCRGNHIKPTCEEVSVTTEKHNNAIRSDQDISGMGFNRLTALRPAGQAKDGRPLWLCRCECGKEVVVRKYQLMRYGQPKSCGCDTNDRKRAGKTTHGMSRTSEYTTWFRMRNRCYDLTAHNYSYYGGRGIVMCERWKESFEAFLEDMGKKPSAKHSIERIDNDGAYEKSNCYWATSLEQGHNKRNNRWIEFAGETKTLADWAKQYGHPNNILHGRLAHGWTIEEALTTPVQKRRAK